MAANRRSQDLTERMIDGFLQYDYQEIWQVDATGIAAALQDASLPQIGQPYLISGVSQPVYCYQRQPRRRNDAQAKTVFDVICLFTNAVTRYDRTVEGIPAVEPEQIVPRVDIAFEEYSEQTGFADNGLIGIFDYDLSPALFDPGLSYQLPPNLLNGNAPAFGVRVPMQNSAGDPFENVNVRKHTKRITYWTWHRDWDSNWDEWLDVVNSSEVTITQSDKDGQRLRYTFPAYTLLINDIVKEDHWRDGKLYFRRGIVISYNRNTWFSVFPDKGFNELLYTGQYDADGTAITDSNMDSWFGTKRRQYESIPVTMYRPAEDTGPRNEFLPVAAAEPQYLNGHGRLVGFPSPVDASGSPKNVVYMNYQTGDYSELGIS
jgi:hypothetical protein